MFDSVEEETMERVYDLPKNETPDEAKTKTETETKTKTETSDENM